MGTKTAAIIAAPVGFVGAAESKALLATLPAELNQVWGRAEEQAVLKALRAQAAVTVLPEASEAISGQNDSRN